MDSVSERIPWFCRCSLDRVTKLQKEFDRMLKDDKVTDAVTYENTYQPLTASAKFAIKT